ncbi:MAG TPA: hypothetical protein VGK67_28795 [Myxococcales bacterium]
MESRLRFAPVLWACALLCGVGCRGDGEKYCRALAVGGDISGLPTTGKRLSSINIECLRGPGAAIQCCGHCSQAPCTCSSQTPSPDCSDPENAPLDYYQELGGEFDGLCTNNPDGVFECVVGVRDGKVVAVFGNCWT